MGWTALVSLSCAASVAALVGGVTWALCQAAKEGDRELPGEDFDRWEQQFQSDRVNEIAYYALDDEQWRK